MKKTVLIAAGLLASFAMGFYICKLATDQPKPKPEVAEKSSTKHHTLKEKEGHMKLGAFSISLSVKDLKVSKAFYENLGFSHFAGSEAQNYLIMKNGNALVGLFQGMFQGNILTFNPGWDENAQNVDNFDDVRAIQKELKSKNVKLDSEADESTTGPGSIMLTDPDGNMVLIDQHR